eukprot:Skav207120  [mRNA]  locus=scaffold1369:91:6252:+ [translate_table: standard]
MRSLRRRAHGPPTVAPGASLLVAFLRQGTLVKGEAERNGQDDHNHEDLERMQRLEFGRRRCTAGLEQLH